jgi:AAA family ATP:ADP antiporter
VSQTGRHASRFVNRVLAGATDVRPGEARSVLSAGLLFFLVLAVVMVLRPVREAMALSQGIEQVRMLFLATVAATLLLVPAFGFLVAHAPRGVFLSVVYRCCALILIGFYVLTAFVSTSQSWVAPVYYVFHSVFNLFLVSLFWAFLADLFTISVSKRLFPPIAVGGTLGAVAGAGLAWAWATWIGPDSLFLVAAVLLEAAVWTTKLVARTRRGQPGQPRSDKCRIGGHSLRGITVLLHSPYLLAIGLFLVITAVVSTFLYFTELRIVENTAESVRQRTVVFAYINVWTQVATLVAQAFIAGRMMRLMGVGTALAVLPVYAAAGFAVLAFAPTLMSYTIIVSLHKAIQRGITRPARETLFTVVPREDKYKAKSFIDTFGFRTGDAAGAQLEQVARAFGPGLTSVASATAVIAIGWSALGLWLGRSQARLAGDSPRT